MQIKKSFHFYAAHRNELLKDKCFNLHGHTYYVDCTFNVTRNKEDPNVTLLFSEFNPIDIWLKTNWDHGLFLNSQDPLLPYLNAFMKEEKSPLKIYVLPRATSVENICYELFRVLLEMDFNVATVSIRETTTSTVTYNRSDYEMDKVAFNEVKTECDCVFDESTKRCVICGITHWEWKLKKRRRKNEEHSAN